MPRLDDDIKKRLDESITLAEVEGAVRNLKGGKSPRPDGLGAAFYKKFIEIVAPFFLVFSEAYQTQVLQPPLCEHTLC